MSLRVLVFVVAAVLFPTELWAQPDRYHVGLRMLAFEAAWDEQPDEVARRRSIPTLNGAVKAFFSFQLGEVGRGLDTARQSLRSERPPEGAIVWAESLVFRPSKRLLETGTPELAFSLKPFYKTPVTMPADASLRLTLLGQPEPSRDFPIKALPLEGAFGLPKTLEGDHTLVIEIRQGAKVLARQEQGLSLGRKVGERLDAVKKALDAVPADKRTTEIATARFHHDTVRELFDGATKETNYPAARLLGEAESLLATQPVFGKGRVGQFWLMLSPPKGNAIVRLMAPEAVRKGEPLPLVVALHGAGGSENLFFEGYGRGRVVKECAQRGWLLIAPRNGGFGGGLDMNGIICEVARYYPVDRKRVYLVGHSMGAGQAVALATTTPEAYAGVAALGGGGRIQVSEGLKRIPFFVGVGKQDFALAGARSLTTALRKGEVKTVEAREYDDVEHMVIVQVALPEVFTFFENSARR